MPPATETIPPATETMPADSAPVRGGTTRKTSRPDAKPDVIVRTVRLAWRTRALHGPVTVPLAIYVTAQGAYAARGGQDLALAALPLAAGIGGSCYHRIHRRRAGRPLALGQQAWQWAASAATSLYLGLASVINPHAVAMDILLGALATPLAVAWWARSHLIKPVAVESEPGQAHAETAAPHPETDPAGELAAKYAKAWADGLAGPRGRFPGSRLTAITPNPEHLGGGMTGIAVLAADGGSITHVPRDLADAKEIIHLALLRANPTLHPANLLIEPQDDGTTLVKMLEHNPLTRVQSAAPSPPGTFTHRVGRTSTGEPVTTTLWVPGFGRRHRGIVGSTGSGKSSVMNLLIGLDGHTFTGDGQPLACPVICDPHGGVSYAPWQRLVRIAHTPEQIAGALLLVCIEIKRRLRWMREQRTDLVVPSPGMPMIPVYIDEVVSARRMCAAAGVPIEPMLEMIANEGRKTACTLEIGMLAFSEEVLRSTLILDALSGNLVILRSKAAATGLKVNTGNWSSATNPQNIPEEFADRSPTTGLGYFLRGEQAPLTVRYDYADASIADGAAFAAPYPVGSVPFTTVLPEPDEKGRIPDPLAALDYWVQELTVRAERAAAAAGPGPDLGRMSAADAPGAVPDPAPSGTGTEDAEVAGETREAHGEALPEPVAATPSLMDTVTGAADGDAWERLRAMLAAVGMPMSVEDLHAATGIAKSTISMAFGRRRGKTPPQIVRLQQGRLVWYALPEYENVPPYEGAVR